MNLCIQTQRSFDVIGVSETWNSALNAIVINIDINGYKSYDTGSMGQNGGVGLYVKTSLVSSSRDDFNFKCEGFETTWVEVQNKNTKNLLFCCIYRHPRSEKHIYLAPKQDYPTTYQQTCFYHERLQYRFTKS